MLSILLGYKFRVDKIGDNFSIFQREVFNEPGPGGKPQKNFLFSKANASPSINAC